MIPIPIETHRHVFVSSYGIVPEHFYVGPLVEATIKELCAKMYFTKNPSTNNHLSVQA